MLGADKMFGHDDKWRVLLTGKIHEQMIPYFELTKWLTQNNIVWRIINKDTLEFDLREDAMMFFLRFK